MYLHTLIPHKSSQQEMSHIFPFNLGLFQPSKNQKIKEKETEREREKEEKKRERERGRGREGERPRKKKLPPFPVQQPPDIYLNPSAKRLHLAAWRIAPIMTSMPGLF